MSVDWPLVRVGDVCSLIVDCVNKTAPVSIEQTPFRMIRTTNVRNGRLDLSDCRFVDEDTFKMWTRRASLEEGDVILTREAPIGEVGRVPKQEGLFLGQRLMQYRADPGKLDRLFLFYSFLSPQLQHQFRSHEGSGSVVSHIRVGDCFKFEMRLPPLAIQRKIGEVLGALDDKIDINRHINQTLEAMAQAIFKSWFVDFDPVRAKIAAKAEGRDPLRAAMSAISGKLEAELDALLPEQYEQLAATAVLFPDELEESELGEIPKGWLCGVLGDICNFTAGSAFKPEHQGNTEGDYPFIKVSDMNLAGNEIFIRSANNYVSELQRSEMKAKLHPLGATVFAKIGVALVSNRRRLLTTPTIIDNNMMSASPIEGKSGQYFLYSLLSTIDFNTLVSGTALPYINVSDLKKIAIVRPQNDIYRAFESRATSIFSMMQALAAQSLILAATRDTLLPKLLSGELETSEIVEG